MEMSQKSKKELIKQAKSRYLKSSRVEKGKILDELCANTSLHRKYLIERLSARIDLSFVSPINRKRRETYDANVIHYLTKIWKIFDYPCGQRLAPMLPEYIRVLERFKELIFPDGVKEKLLKVKSATIDRRLKKFRTLRHKKVFSTTKPGSMLKKNIPIKTSSWDETRLGYGELDTVAHCGGSAAGEFIVSLTYTDICSQWTISEAVMGKAQKRIKAGLDNIANRLPFPLKGIDPDNGGEFINWQLYNHCAANNIEFTRGRPYAKNDNAHIEQKNYTHVRKLIGYKRLEKEHQLKKLNDLYWNEWDFYKNFFLPNKKLIEKKRIGAKIVKKYDDPKTPYQRLLEHEKLPESENGKLRAVYAKLNPAELKRSIDRKISKI
ncbi:MAG: transposase [Candidatus Moranbacteria bacterium]|nr:transposase [Candidatus Moranbacteria bacterium]